MGMTCTPLGDGRVVCIGGEHEDDYDPDFNIYNDIIVLGPTASEIAIYGYPKEVFPPTDSHSATLTNNGIIIVGCLGYPEDRRPHHTPVFRLDTTTFSIQPIPGIGQSPGWIFKHEATLDEHGKIIISEGEILFDHLGVQRFRTNTDKFSLDPNIGAWSVAFKVPCAQFMISQVEQRQWNIDDNLNPEILFSLNFPASEFLGESETKFREGWGWFKIPHGLLRIRVGLWNEVDVLAQGWLSLTDVMVLVDSIRAKATEAMGTAYKSDLIFENLSEHL
jgi:hypothetical protein